MLRILFWQILPQFLMLDYSSEEPRTYARGITVIQAALVLNLLSPGI